MGLEQLGHFINDLQTPYISLYLTQARFKPRSWKAHITHTMASLPANGYANGHLSSDEEIDLRVPCRGGNKASSATSSEEPDVDSDDKDSIEGEDCMRDYYCGSDGDGNASEDELPECHRENSHQNEEAMEIDEDGDIAGKSETKGGVIDEEKDVGDEKSVGVGIVSGGGAGGPLSPASECSVDQPATEHWLQPEASLLPVEAEAVAGSQNTHAAEAVRLDTDINVETDTGTEPSLYARQRSGGCDSDAPAAEEDSRDLSSTFVAYLGNRMEGEEQVRERQHQEVQQEEETVRNVQEEEKGDEEKDGGSGQDSTDEVEEFDRHHRKESGEHMDRSDKLVDPDKDRDDTATSDGDDDAASAVSPGKLCDTTVPLEYTTAVVDNRGDTSDKGDEEEEERRDDSEADPDDSKDAVGDGEAGAPHSTPADSEQADEDETGNAADEDADVGDETPAAGRAEEEDSGESVEMPASHADPQPAGDSLDEGEIEKARDKHENGDDEKHDGGLALADVDIEGNDDIKENGLESRQALHARDSELAESHHADAETGVTGEITNVDEGQREAGLRNGLTESSMVGASLCETISSAHNEEPEEEAEKLEQTSGDSAALHLNEPEILISKPDSAEEDSEDEEGEERGDSEMQLEHEALNGECEDEHDVHDTAQPPVQSPGGADEPGFNENEIKETVVDDAAASGAAAVLEEAERCDDGDEQPNQSDEEPTTFIEHPSPSGEGESPPDLGSEQPIGCVPPYPLSPQPLPHLLQGVSQGGASAAVSRQNEIDHICQLSLVLSRSSQVCM